MFWIGQKVECINGSRLLGLIQTGDRLTISNIHTDPLWGDILGLEFIEAPNPPMPYYGYNSINFRPIVEIKTDISVFTKMLDKIKEDA